MNEQERKARILRSHAFATWWEARQTEDPVPSNPYQAYMIDVSLHAKVHPHHTWQVQPNRRDLIDVDLPRGEANGVPTYAPAYKPRTRREAPEKSPELPKRGPARELTLRAEQMAIRHGIPAPTVVVGHGEGPLRSYTKTGAYRMGGGALGFTGIQSVHIGTSGKSGKDRKPTFQEIGALYHEVGHDVHAAARFGKGSPLPAGIAPFKGTPRSYSDEQAATKLARAEIKRTLPSKGGGQAIANWTLAYGLHTYRQGWKERGNPVVVKGGKIISGGEF